MVRFQCQVTAEPEPSLTWFYNDQQLTSSPRIQLTFDKTTTTLTILGATLQDTGDYTCRATNTLGEATTKTFLRVRRTYASVVYNIVLNPLMGTGTYSAIYMKLVHWPLIWYSERGGNCVGPQPALAPSSLYQM